MGAIVHNLNMSYWLKDYSAETIVEYEQNKEKYSACIDGHYWLEVNGKPLPETFPKNTKKFEVCNAEIFYKPADETTQKIAIEIMYRSNEAYYNVKRDTPLFQKFISSRKFEENACLFTVLKLQQKYPNGKIVFGSVGFKYPNGVNKKTAFCNRLPKNAVWWIYGCGNFKKITDFRKPYEYHEIFCGVEDYFTIEE